MIQVLVGGSVRALERGISGDVYATYASTSGPVVALVDGLGHGARAAEASEEFLRSVRTSLNEPLDVVFVRAHHSLMKTRGAVAAVARFDEARCEVEIGGLGNITVLVVRAGTKSMPVVLMQGILGTAFRKVRAQTLPFGINDALILHTDGIRSRFDVTIVRALAPQNAAEELLRVAGKLTDDAGVVFARAIAAPVEARVVAPRREAVPGVSRLSPRIVRIQMTGDAQSCAVAAREYARHASMDLRAQWEVSIAASELATNVLKFAAAGTMTLTFDAETLVIEVVDDGHGIQEVAAAISDGWSEGRVIGPDTPRVVGHGLGVGLGTVHRMMDHVEIETSPEKGTRIVARKRR